MTQPPGSFHPFVKRGMQGLGIEPVELGSRRRGKHGSGHGVVECSLNEDA